MRQEHITNKTTDADAPPASIKEATMKKTLWAKALVIVAVFFVAACSRNTPPVASEGAKGGLFSYSPREIPTDGEKLLSVALVIRGEHTPSLSEVRRMEREMVEKIPEGRERDDFQLAIEDIKRVLGIVAMNGYYYGWANNFPEITLKAVNDSYGGIPPENTKSIIFAYKHKKISFADILPSMKAAGCFFTESDRARFGKNLGW